MFTLVILTFVLTGDRLAPLFRRFDAMAEVLKTIDLSAGFFSISDTRASIILFGGRLEEITGILEYFQRHPSQTWFGSPPGANYVWRIDFSDYLTTKSYSHLTWFGYIFRFGLLPTATLLILLLFYLFRGADTNNPLWLVYVGVLVSATFGANLLSSPSAWIMIALYFRYGKMLSKSNM